MCRLNLRIGVIGSANLVASQAGGLKNRVDHGLLPVSREDRAARQTQAAAKKLLGNAPTNHSAVSIDRLQMHRLPNGARFDIVSL
jgi:hypothetical protein